jgi:hypothetical protein
MATKPKDFARELLDALKGGDGASAPADERKPAGNGAPPRKQRSNGSARRRAQRANGSGSRETGANGASEREARRAARERRTPPTGERPERAAAPSLDDVLDGTATRYEDGEDGQNADRGGDGLGAFLPPKRGDSVFQDIRGRARDLAQGFRDGTHRAGEGLRALRERDGSDNGESPRSLLPGREGGGDEPPWRRTPGLPKPPGPPPSDQGRTSPRLKKLRVLLVLAGVVLLAMVSWFFGIMMSVAQDLPALENREQYKHAKNSIVRDRNGTTLTTLTSNDRRILIPSEEISQTVKQAVVAIEDQRFYEHRGVDFQGIGRAIVQDVLSRQASQGASTITQQFVKNALRAQNSRTVFQKLRESALAYHLERRWSKDKILTQYLNSIYFGEGAYGIESAAQTYFGWNHAGCGDSGNRCSEQLEPEEAALLAGMISSPSGYSPRVNPESATERRNLVLDRMVEQGLLTEEAAAESAETPIPKPSQINPPEEDSASPYFTTWLRQQGIMSPLLNDASLFHDDNAVGGFDSG